LVVAVVAAVIIVLTVQEQGRTAERQRILNEMAASVRDFRSQAEPDRNSLSAQERIGAQLTPKCKAEWLEHRLSPECREDLKRTK
jgi:hypothetical protein